MTNSVVAATSITHTSVTTGTDLSLENNVGGAYLMRLSQTGGAAAGLTLQGVNNGTNIIKSNGAASELSLESENIITTTSVGETEINCAAFDVNASGNISIDTPATTTITSEGITLECPLTSINGIIIRTNEAANDIDITTIGATSDINLLSTLATVTITAATEADITCATLDLNASTTATLDAPTITTTSTGTTQINSAALDINATGAITADTDDPITITSTANGITLSSFGEQDITCGSLDINSAGTATIDSTSNMSLTSGGTLILGSGANETEINCGVLDINASGAATLDATSLALTATTGLMSLNTAAGQDIQINAGDDLVVTSDQVSFTTTNTTGNQFIHNATVTSGKQMELKANTIDGYTARLSQTGTNGLTITGRDNGINLIKSFGAASTLKLESANNILLQNVNDMTLDCGSELQLSSTGITYIDGGIDVNITGVAGSVGLNAAAGNVSIDATGNVNIDATDINIYVPTAGRFFVYNNSVQKLRISSITAEFNVAITTDSTFVASGAATLSSTLAVTGTTTLTGAATLTGGFTSSASSNMNHNFLIQQSTYPPSSTSALGYTGTVTVASTTLATSITQEATWNLPSKGVWLVCSTVTFSTNSAANTEYFHAVISTTTNSATEASAGLSYFEEDDQGVAGSGTRDKICLSGVVRVNAATALFFNASGKTTGTAPSVAAAITYTRLG